MKYNVLDPALFSNEPPPGYVRRSGKIFELGAYEDKKFSLDEKEADRAVEMFKPVPIGLEHVPTVLSGKLGVLRKMWREGTSLFGDADIPSWLDDLLKDTSSPVSCAWDRATKAIKGVDWVLDPRVQGTALMSAYAEFSAKEDAADDEDEDTLFGKASHASDKEAPVNRRRGLMGLREALGKNLTAAFSRPAPAAKTEEKPKEEPKQATINFSAPGTAPAGADKEEGEEDDAAFSEFRAEQITSRAQELADRLITDAHIMSSGRQLALACFSQGGFDNEKGGPSIVTFTREDGTVVTDRVGLLYELLSKHTPAHSLFSQQLPANMKVALFNGDKSEKDKKSAQQMGQEQADEFNKTLPGYQQVFGNNGAGSATVQGHMNGNGR